MIIRGCVSDGEGWGGELMLRELRQVDSLVRTNDETGANKSIKPSRDLITTSLKAEPTVKLMSCAFIFYFMFTLIFLKFNSQAMLKFSQTFKFIYTYL